jgi:hypothetical protein
MASLGAPGACRGSCYRTVSAISLKFRLRKFSKLLGYVACNTRSAAQGGAALRVRRRAPLTHLSLAPPQ